MSRVIYLADAVDAVTATTYYGKDHVRDIADEAHVRALINQGKAALMGADIRNIRAPAVTATGSTIVFDIDQACTGVKVDYGTTTAYGSSQNATPTSQSPGQVTITLSGLTTATLYHYRVSVTVGGATTLSPDYTFTTL